MMSQSEMERQELEDEYGAAYGDPRRCPRHPHVKTSSPDGMFDAPCGVCESEMDEDANNVKVARSVFTVTKLGDWAQLTVEASTLGWSPQRRHPPYTIIVPSRSGQPVVYDFVKADIEDDTVIGWKYTPCQLSRKLVPACANTSIIVFNT